MLAIRLYVTALILMFLLVVLATRGIGPLEALVIVCPLLYLIADLREELTELRQLEAKVSQMVSQLVSQRSR
jgi:type II secretory pathway component PulM